MFLPAAMAPWRSTCADRAGRRIRVTDAVDALRRSRRRPSDGVSGRERRTAWTDRRPRHEPWPDPIDRETSEAGSPDHAGWWFRVVWGGFGTGEQTVLDQRENPPCRRRAGAPFGRTVLSGEIVCPSQQSDHGLHDINADYTMLIGRYPLREWVGLEVARDRRGWHLDGLGHAVDRYWTVRHQRWCVAGSTPDRDRGRRADPQSMSGS